MILNLGLDELEQMFGDHTSVQANVVINLVHMVIVQLQVLYKNINKLAEYYIYSNYVPSLRQTRGYRSTKYGTRIDIPSIAYECETT